jgi:hypothetical protein
MADGMNCINCGFYEGDHKNRDEGFFSEEGLKVVLEGRKFSLKECPRFYPENPKLAATLKKEAEDEELAQEMRRVKNLAYGTW